MTKLNLSYDGDWNEQEKVWKGNLTFQQVYPLALRRAAAEDMGPVVHNRPQEDALMPDQRLMYSGKSTSPISPPITSSPVHSAYPMERAHSRLWC